MTLCPRLSPGIIDGIASMGAAAGQYAVPYVETTVRHEHGDSASWNAVFYMLMAICLAAATFIARLTYRVRTAVTSCATRPPPSPPLPPCLFCLPVSPLALNCNADPQTASLSSLPAPWCIRKSVKCGPAARASRYEDVFDAYTARCDVTVFRTSFIRSDHPKSSKQVLDLCKLNDFQTGPVLVGLGSELWAAGWPWTVLGSCMPTRDDARVGRSADVPVALQSHETPFLIQR